MTRVDKGYYEDIKDIELEPQNRAKIYNQGIG